MLKMTIPYQATCRSFALWVPVFLFAFTAWACGDEPSDVRYHDLVQDDNPVAYWRFEESNARSVINHAAQSRDLNLNGVAAAEVEFDQPGPRNDFYPLFDAKNKSVAFSGAKGFIRVQDPGPSNVLDFSNGDSITLEAWVLPVAIGEGQQVYVVGKGRTTNPDVASENQNYALRLRGTDGTARLSFLFRNADNRAGNQSDFHRWNSIRGFLSDGNWHHIAVSYTFGKPNSILGYLDGEAVTGTWDLGGATDKPPVVDDDEVWIGSSMGGNPGSTFNGLIDEVAVYRTALDAERLRKRYRAELPDRRALDLAALESHPNAVLVEILEGKSAAAAIAGTGQTADGSYTQSSLAFIGVPQKYSPKGIVVDRSNPFALRARTKRTLPAGEYQFLLRAKGATQLYIDGQLVSRTDPINKNASGHESVPELPDPQFADLQPLAPGHQERIFSIKLDEGQHVFRLESQIGGAGVRAELGELVVALARQGEPFQILAAESVDGAPLNEAGWHYFVTATQTDLQEMDRRNRHEAASDEAEYWAQRHAYARQELAGRPRPALPEVPPEYPVGNEVDHFIGVKLQKHETRPTEQIDDYEFLRRVTLDTVGVIPTREEIETFLADQSSDRRARAIDRLLDDPRWADHWVAYWQDVLAENPGILKPKLNNTGPFRYWIHESFLDNKPLDQFATELIMMEGSQYGGAPAGFAMATQNDVPMAAKAHVIGTAFLGLEMKCARCHDSPFHSFTQENLFNVAAMLEKRTLSLPESSTVPLAPGARRPAVTISLKPGAKIEAAWPFDELTSADVPASFLRNQQDPRERLAAIITSPGNPRFAEVVVNRLWQRYLGLGLVDPVDDWENGVCSHPELLEFLAYELASNGYDLKHVARLILNSHVYQREPITAGAGGRQPQADLFAGPLRRRMSAEQVVDSMFAAADKPFRSEQLTLDPEGRRDRDTFLNFGAPRRAWEFTSLSNERDRPALALPMAQSVVDVLMTFGWRDSRPNPITVRDDATTVLQPLTLANGIAAARITRLSDDNEITQLCLESRNLPDLVDQVSLQLLSRPATDDERDLFVELLAEGYDDRVAAPDSVTMQRAPRLRNAVSWSNHLSPEATRIKLELERAAREGDPPTDRLNADWRERMEDVVWAMLNSPEFVFVP